MGLRIGTGHLGSPNLQTSTANQEVVPSKPTNWTIGYNFYKFSFDNDDAVTVKINGGAPIYLKASQGIDVDYMDAPVYSFIVVESGIQFNWVGFY